METSLIIQYPNTEFFRTAFLRQDFLHCYFFCLTHNKTIYEEGSVEGNGALRLKAGGTLMQWHKDIWWCQGWDWSVLPIYALPHGRKSTSSDQNCIQNNWLLTLFSGLLLPLHCPSYKKGETKSKWIFYQSLVWNIICVFCPSKIQSTEYLYGCCV